MKTRIFFLAVVISASCAVHAQESPPPVEAAAETAVEEPKKTQVQSIAPAGKPAEARRWQDKIETGGLLPDIARSKETPRQLFSLRKPADPKRDLKNVYFSPSEGRPMGFKLFSFRY